MSSPIVQFRNVQKSFGKLCALQGISLDIHAGEFFALLGPNGAGKSTLINILAGLTYATSGQVLVQGHDVVKDYKMARKALGIVPQELVYDPFFTVREMLRFQAGYFGYGRENDVWIDEIIERLDLTEQIHTNMRRLSGGMKRRALIAQALVHRPPIIVLDEPTAGVDVELRQLLWQFILELNQQGHTIILTTHYLEEAQRLCQRVGLLKQGKIIALDYTEQLLQQFSRQQLRLTLNTANLPPSLSTRASQTDSSVFTFTLKTVGEVETILAELRTHNIAVLDMVLAETDLEDVFLSLLRKSV